MPPQLYVLSPRAAQQVEDLIFEVAEFSGEDRGQRVERLLYAAFTAIAA
jgi:plasmid stabilization system protein ParE